MSIPVRNSTDRKRAEDALEESERQWKAIFENSPTTSFVVDAAGTILSVNPFGAEQLGYTVDELIGRPMQNLAHESDRAAVQRNAAACLEQLGRAMRWELRKIRKDGELIWVRETARATPINKQPVILIVWEDVTETRRATESLHEMQVQLTHANRVAVMGQLTAAIAHEVTQPITATVTNAQVALRFLDRQPPDLAEVRAALVDIVKDGDRAHDLIGRIRDHMRKRHPGNISLAIMEAIERVTVSTRRTAAQADAAKNAASRQPQLDDDLPLIQGDRVELQQGMLNLVTNAAEAMSDVSEGARELLIRTGKAELDDVLVTVQDSGPGLAPDGRERLFETFYTTKPSGLGMGLSICRSIIEAHGGRLWASANAPRGAVFQFTVPANMA